MKKLFLLLALCLFASPVWAADVTWHNANSFACAWDASTADIDGDPLTLPVTYEVLLANANTDPTKASPWVATVTDLTQATITLDSKGRYFVGVRAICDGEVSGINWADEPADQGTTPLWGSRWRVPPRSPQNIRP